MVVGTMIGSGIYLIPSTTAPYGPNIIAAFGLTIVGTVALAMAVASLARRLPGGPYFYIARAFGDVVAFITMWSYLISVWTAIAAVCIAAGGALGYFLPAIGSGVGLAAFAIFALVVLAAINSTGARSAGIVQIVATLIKIVPLLLVGLLVLFRFGDGQPLQPLADVPFSISALVAAAALMLFAFTGFETAALSANVTDNPNEVVPGATIRGTVFVALIYLIATLSVLWLLPSAVAAQSGSPFADAITPALGPVAGVLVAVIAAISALGTGNALVLVSVEISRAIANAGDIPPVFRKTNAAGVATVALWTSVAVGTLLILFSISDSFVEVFKFVALLSAVASLVLYLVCAAAALKLKTERSWLAVIAIFYAIAMFVGAGLEPTLWGFALMAAGLPIRWFSRRRWRAPSQEATAAA